MQADTIVNMTSGNPSTKTHKNRFITISGTDRKKGATMLKLVNELFAHRNLKTEIGGYTLNRPPVAATPEYYSGLHRGSGVPKISTAGLIFDLIFGEEARTKGPRLAVYYDRGSSDSVYMVMDGVGYYINEYGIRSTAEPVHHRTLAIPSVVYQLCSRRASTELLERFQNYGINVDAKCQKESDLYAFCDTFYYGYAIDNKEIAFDQNLTEEEIKRMFTSSAAMDLQRTCFGFDDSLFGHSKYEKKPKKAVKKAVKKAAGKSFIDRCLNGEFMIDREWSDDQKELVVDRKYLDTFESTEDFEDIVTGVKKAADKVLALEKDGSDYADVMRTVGTRLNRMLLGKPGTGKTAIMMALSAATGLPYYPVVFSKHTEEDIVEGKTKIVDGHPQFVLTDIPKYWDKGGLFDFEEMNAADPGMLIVFNMALEDPYVINVNGYEKKYRSPLSFVFACENTGIEGTNPNPPALSNRFQTKYKLGDPSEETFKSILVKKTGQSKECINWVYEAYTKTINWLKSPEIGEDELVNLLSMRSCMGAINNMIDGQTPVRAVKNSIVNAVAEADLALSDQLENEVLVDLREPDFEIKD